jgi:outer membrane protein assembly factor BamD (BamD/ComL family)
MLFSCATTGIEKIENLSQPIIFQRAQEALDTYEWDRAMMYYQYFIETFPQDMANVVAAEYEIAFITYKKENYKDSRNLFEALIKKYETLDSPGIPEWPRVLSEKLISIIDEK